MKVIASKKDTYENIIELAIENNEAYIIKNKSTPILIDNMKASALLSDDWVADAFLDMYIAKTQEKDDNSEFEKLASMLD